MRRNRKAQNQRVNRPISIYLATIAWRVGEWSRYGIARGTNKLVSNVNIIVSIKKKNATSPRSAVVYSVVQGSAVVYNVVHGSAVVYSFVLCGLSRGSQIKLIMPSYSCSFTLVYSEGRLDENVISKSFSVSRCSL